MVFFLLALLLGIKHSYDADHLLAVSNLLTRSRSLRQTIKMSVIWASGHMITATIVTAILFVFRDSLLPLLNNFEILVALMLILLGIVSIRQARMHLHSDDDRHVHKHMFGIGIIHGLASNDELLVLVTSTLGLSSFLSIVAGIAVFSFGVVLGMLAYSLLLTYPLIKISREGLSRVVNMVAGALSLVYGLLLLFGLV